MKVKIIASDDTKNEPSLGRKGELVTKHPSLGKWGGISPKNGRMNTTCNHLIHVCIQIRPDAWKAAPACGSWTSSTSTRARENGGRNRDPWNGNSRNEKYGSWHSQRVKSIIGVLCLFKVDCFYITFSMGYKLINGFWTSCATCWMLQRKSRLWRVTRGNWRRSWAVRTKIWGRKWKIRKSQTWKTTYSFRSTPGWISWDRRHRSRKQTTPCQRVGRIYSG